MDHIGGSIVKDSPRYNKEFEEFIRDEAMKAFNDSIEAKVLEVFDNNIKKPLGEEVSNMLNDSLALQENR